ncbi:MAG: pyruvate ferredoxin oxidoreductase [Euryarchaeota archaeon]|nr:pyruvate ferredoxin oxidoreductase [Euryarchaeota archaeon]
MMRIMRGNEATALAAKLCRPNVIPAYPITPSTMFPERISEYVADGELDSYFLLAESEHSALSAAIGASSTGARVCTATASQGLALMHEMLFIAAGMRLPIVMAVGNRALSAPINIWCDQQDTVSERDAGWIHYYAENNQECLDFMIMAFKVGEDRRVYLPALVGLDAFVLTHTMEPVDVPEQAAVDDFLPPYVPHAILDPKTPMTIGALGTPEYYMETRYALQKALMESAAVIDEVFDQFAKTFGRKYGRVSKYRSDDAEVIFVTMGSMTGTARVAVDELRARGKRAGLVKICVLRPFPFKELKDSLCHAKVVAVTERAISLGYGGAIYAELAGHFVNEARKPLLSSFIMGLGGRDVLPEHFYEMYEKSEQVMAGGKVEEFTGWAGLNREVL